MEALDQLTGGLLLAAAATGGGFALSLFDVKGELARVSSALVDGLNDRLQGLGRFERSERLAAAHAVVAVTAYFEALSTVDLPFDVRELEIESSEQVALAGGGSPATNRLGALAAGLLEAEVPMPLPQYPYEVTLEALDGFYYDLSGQVVRFVTGLAVWDRLDDSRRRQFAETVTRDLPGRAVSRYEELFRRLAVQFPEVGFWANLVDHQATRAQLRSLSGGLAGLERLLTEMAAGKIPDDRRSSLSRAYRAALERPILTWSDSLQGVRLPALGAAYVTPDFRVSEVVGSERIAEESWWRKQSVRTDLEGFLLGYLTSPQATAAPLMVLGQPGSGKSVLTRVLAARLPPGEFLTVRVELREVPADADLQFQLEYAIRASTGEDLPWTDLVRSAEGALSVVLLDGFDELLQATGVTQTDYLKKVAYFQRREADQGRPVAVVVTSRTAVADRARPADNMVAVRLEPFQEAQIRQWLQVWNETNAAFFSSTDRQPLTPAAVFAHGDLAGQPLLLLMLALYDADSRAVHLDEISLGHTELYERLLTSFAEREVLKTGATLPQPQVDRAVERELLNLSIVAFAMFNRSRQWVTEPELDADLAALVGEVNDQDKPSDLRARLTAAQMILGRFFFVHEGQATRDDLRLRTYEFLHATFSEYLIARCVTAEVTELAETAMLTVRRSRHTPVDDTFLHAVLSFMPLTMRGTTVAFVTERLKKLADRQRAVLRDLLLDLFRDALMPRHDTRHFDYAPQHLPVPARHAAYSANLLLLAVLVSGQLAGHDLFPAAIDPVAEWRKIALLWRSQLPPEGWSGLIDILEFDRTWQGKRRELHLRPRTEKPPWRSDPYWTYDFGPDHHYRPRLPRDWFSWITHDNTELREQARFLCTESDDILVHALEPFAEELGSTITTFHDYGVKPPVSAANSLIALWLATARNSNHQELTQAYETCLQIALHSFSPNDRETRRRYRHIFLHQLAEHWEKLDPAWLKDAMAEIRKGGKGEKDEKEALLAAARSILPEQLNNYLTESQ